MLREWTGRSRVVVAGRVRGRQWSKRLSTPLDGDVSVRLQLPPATNAALEVLAPDGRVVARARWSSAREQTATFQACGQRSFSLRLTNVGPQLVSRSQSGSVSAAVAPAETTSRPAIR